MFTPLGLESRIEELAKELTGIVVPCDSELESALISELTRLEAQPALCFGVEGPASDLTVEVSSESARFVAVGPGREARIATIPTLGSWQEATEEAAQAFGGQVVAWRLTAEGAAVTLARRGGERIVVEVTELAA